MQVLSALQSEYPGPHRRRVENGLITDEGVAVGGAFDSDTATGMMPAAQRVARMLSTAPQKCADG